MFPETKSRETLRLDVDVYSKKRKINNTYTITVFHDIMTINRKFYSVNKTFASSK